MFAFSNVQIKDLNVSFNMWFVLKKVLACKSLFCYEMFLIKMLDSLVVKCRVSLRISLFHPVGFTLCVCVFCVFYMKSNEQWRSADLQEGNIDSSTTWQLVYSHHFYLFLHRKINLKMKSWSNPEDSIWQKSWVYLCFSIFGIQKCQRCCKIQIECLCVIHKMYDSLGFFKNLFLYVLHTSVLLF